MCTQCKAHVADAKRKLRGKPTRRCSQCNGTGEYARGRQCYACSGRGAQTLADIARSVAYWLHRGVQQVAARPVRTWE